MRNLEIIAIKPSIFLKRVNETLMQLVQIDVQSVSGEHRIAITAYCGEKEIGHDTFALVDGKNALPFYIAEPERSQTVCFIFQADGAEIARQSIPVTPPRHWEVHVVQTAHHDPGYTDLPSNVLKLHNEHLDQAIDLAEQTAGYPDDARFRIVIEQAWSLHNFLKSARPERAAKMIDMLRAGRFEMTALFGNMTTELCGHETLIRALYHSAAISRQYGIPLVSAELNDVTGFSWGLSRVLTDAGIKFFCPGIPLYYNWGDQKFRSFWDVETIFGYDAPGAFWWEAPTDKRILFWCNNSGCGGEYYGSLASMVEGLENAAEKGYPYSVLRWPVVGGNRDNSPYILDYAETIRCWNETWAYPRLICSTDTMFYRAFTKVIPDNLPIWRGELPGQDYPSGATSTAIPTGVNRQNHNRLTTAEKLASAAALYTGMPYPRERLHEAYEESLWYDEHAWGYHFPAGPAARTSEYEKAVSAYRAEAFAGEVADKAMARLADQMRLTENALHLVVFNETSWAKTAPISVPMRELDGTGNVMRLKVDETGAHLKGALLDTRFHVVPDAAFTSGRFDLVDVSTGETVPYQITELTDPFAPTDYAPQRLGLGQGSQRYGFFEDPSILRFDIQFIAEGVPAHGYRAYELKPRDTAPEIVAASDLSVGSNGIENEFYKIKIDPVTCKIVSVLDKQAGRELVDTEDGFYRLIVRDKNSAEQIAEHRMKCAIRVHLLSAEILIEAGAYGHPVIRHRITLYTGIKNIYFETSVFKDPTPLLNAHIAFPFAMNHPSFRYESALSVMDPVCDYLPGAYSDVIAVQNWVRVQDADFHILWSSLDAPLVSLCELWPGYVSPAHRCLVDDSFRHEPQRAEDYTKNGYIYSQLFNNNFGTNFSVSQSGQAVFRYCMTSGTGRIADADATRWGWQNAVAFATMFTDRAAPDGLLLPCGSFIECDCPEVQLLSFKAAENGEGHIMRFCNTTDVGREMRVTVPGRIVRFACRTNITEMDIPGGECVHDSNSFVLHIEANDIVTVRVKTAS